MKQTDEAQAQREERGGELREGSVKHGGAATVEMARRAFAPFLPSWLPVNQRTVPKSLWILMDVTGSLDLQGGAWGLGLCAQRMVLLLLFGLVFQGWYLFHGQSENAHTGNEIPQLLPASRHGRMENS